MLTSDYDKYICNKYGIGARAETGKVNCKQCPLLIDAKELICKATAHYDERRGKWIKDRK
jgi:hypothetical protein